MGDYDALMAYKPSAPAPADDLGEKADQLDRIGRAARDYNENTAALSSMRQGGDKVAPYGLSGLVTGKTGAPGVSRQESAVRGGLQGATLGFGDELAAALDTGVSKIPGVRRLAQLAQPDELPALTDPNVSYAQRRDAYRAKNDAAQAANPGTYLGGELVGGLASLPVGEIGEARTLAQGVKAGAKAGAKLGAASALGTSKADLTRGEFSQAAQDTAEGAAGGALTGGAFGAAGGVAKKVIAKAPENIRKWVLNDIVGDVRGASTPTAKKNLARDAEDVADLVTGDKALEKSLRDASHGGTEAIGKAIDDVDQRLDSVSAPREKLYKDFGKALPEGGFKSGDFVDYLEQEVKNRLKTGKGYDAGEARELKAIVDRIKGAEDWGAGQVPTDKNTATILQNLEKQRASAVAAGEDPSRYETAIRNIRGSSESTPAFNRETVISPLQLRDLVTDAQKTAFEREGGINGTERYNRAREVSRVVEGYLDKLKATAGKTGAKTIQQIENHDTQVSALLRIKNVLQQRANRAQQDALGVQGDGTLGRAFHALAHPKAGLIREGVALGAKGAIGARRAIDRAAVSAKDNAFSRLVLKGMSNGLPLAGAVEAAQAAGRGAATTEGDEE